MEHSKTPWKIGTPPPNGEQTIGTTDGLMVAVTTTGYGLSSEANARRIVACVNACAGLDTALLEKAALTAAHIEARERLSFCTQQIEEERDQLKASLHKLVDKAFEIEQQRDELLAVLEGLMPWVVTQEVACHGLKCREPVCMSCSSDSEEAAEKATYAYKEARAVIQKVRGGE